MDTPTLTFSFNSLDSYLFVYQFHLTQPFPGHSTLPLPRLLLFLLLLLLPSLILITAIIIVNITSTIMSLLTFFQLSRVRHNALYPLHRLPSVIVLLISSFVREKN